MNTQFAVVVNGTAVLVMDFEHANNAAKTYRRIDGNKVMVRRADDRDVAQAIIKIIDLNAPRMRVTVSPDLGRIDTTVNGGYHTRYNENYNVAAIVAHWALTNNARLEYVSVN